MSDDHSGNYLRKQVNASGYPLQIRLSHEVSATEREHGWRVEVVEHRWASSRGEGYIDLILRRAPDSSSRYLAHHLVTECKRFSGGSWVFIEDKEVAGGYEVDEHGFFAPENDEVPRWKSQHIQPRMPSSMFCAVPGQSDKGAPMLERISSSLLLSLEAVASQYHSASNRQSGAMFYPVVITNSPLVVCSLKSDDVDLDTGDLDRDSGEFREVPYVRFCKSMATDYGTKEMPAQLVVANELNLRTVFVVRASELVGFLKAWRVYDR